MEFWASLNVRVLPDDELVFIESIVDLGWDAVPVFRTLRNTRIVAVGGAVASRSEQPSSGSHHADEGPADAATPPSMGGFLQTDPGAVPPGPLHIPFEADPTVFWKTRRGSPLRFLDMSWRRSGRICGLSIGPLG